ncbi:MAG: hypothetical protein RL071_1596 [Pseudomonadota bacterium]
MIVLGIADNHDSGAALLVDGQLVAAVNQERIDRQKGSAAFPWGAIDAALELGGVPAREVDRVVVGTGFTPSAALRALPGLHHAARARGQFTEALHAYIVYQSVLRKTGMFTLELDLSERLLRQRLRQRPFDQAQLELMDHHRAHAEGAYRTQPHDHCLVLTVDAMGDGTTATASVGKDGQLDLVWRQSGLASVNTFYSRITELLGFIAGRHEGKVTGLAALAAPPPALVRHFARRVSFVGPGFSRDSALRPDRPTDPFWAVVRQHSREEVAAAAQRVLEDAVLGFVRYWALRTGLRRVALAGGVFANVRLNQRISALDVLDSVWVIPHMGDGGLALGAALGSVDAAPRALPHAFWGPGYSERDLYKALKRGEIEPVDAAARTAPSGAAGDVEQVAALLSNGGVVGRFAGRMEWGPRALGHRSVLALGRDLGVTARLNAMLQRSEFMPFAPIVRAEAAGRWFSGLDRVGDCPRFMTTCLDATPAFKAACPAAVHVDGTARPQVLRAADDPPLHQLLTRVGALTGAAVLINTSFNMHEEPIVCSPSEAVRAHQAAGLDGLWMGPFVEQRPRFAQGAPRAAG